MNIYTSDKASFSNTILSKGSSFKFLEHPPKLKEFFSLLELRNYSFNFIQVSFLVSNSKSPSNTDNLSKSLAI